MPSIVENREVWGETYDWARDGDEWSEAWGGAEMQWYGSIFPRIFRYLPARTILEIAPGYGRWSRFLRTHCQQLILVDLSERCIERCRQRFAGDEHVSCHVNDGTSLEMVPDGAVDFVFSFDSLVHAEGHVIDAYLRQLSHKLTARGVAFIHHSNLGAYFFYEPMRRVPALRTVMRRVQLMEDEGHWRSFKMSARKMREYATRNGLRCVSQELVNWSTRRALVDCMTVIVRAGDPRAGDHVKVVKNPGFMREARRLAKLAWLYGQSSMRDGELREGETEPASSPRVVRTP